MHQAECNGRSPLFFLQNAHRPHVMSPATIVALCIIMQAMYVQSQQGVVCSGLVLNDCYLASAKNMTGFCALSIHNLTSIDCVYSITTFTFAPTAYLNDVAYSILASLRLRTTSLPSFQQMLSRRSRRSSSCKRRSNCLCFCC